MRLLQLSELLVLVRSPQGRGQCDHPQWGMLLGKELSVPKCEINIREAVEYNERYAVTRKW